MEANPKVKGKMPIKRKYTGGPNSDEEDKKSVDLNTKNKKAFWSLPIEI